MKRLCVLWLPLCLAACAVQEFEGKPKIDLEASARNRVAIAAEYIQKGELEIALKHLQQAMKQAPKLPEAYNVMGALLERDGDLAKAEENYKRALHLKPDYPQAHNNYGVLLFRLGRPAEAMQQFQLAASDLAYENRDAALLNWGQAALAAGDRIQARQAFERAVRVNPRSSDALLELASLTFESGSVEERPVVRDLYRRYQKALAGEPQSARGLWLGMRIARQDNDRDTLASYELALKKLYPDSEEFRLSQQSQP